MHSPFQTAKKDALFNLEKDREDFDMMLQLKLDKHERIEQDLRKSLSVSGH